MRVHPEAEVDPILHDERHDVLGDAVLELRGEHFHEDVAMLLFDRVGSNPRQNAYRSLA